MGLKLFPAQSQYQFLGKEYKGLRANGLFFAAVSSFCLGGPG
jgi:hypothetical protein